MKIAYLRRIQKVLNKNNIETIELVKVSKAFEEINLLRRSASQIMRKTNERTFLLGLEKYKEKMQWINDYMKSKGFEDAVFRNPINYKTSSEDYDYYYELKTLSQYKKEEEERGHLYKV